MKELNHGFLKSYYGDMVNDIAEIFEVFIECNKEDFERIDLHFNNQEYHNAANEFHKIAPSFTSVGLPDLTEICSNIETNLKQNNIAIAIADYNFLKDEVISYLPSINFECNRLKNMQV